MEIPDITSSTILSCKLSVVAVCSGLYFVCKAEEMPGERFNTNIVSIDHMDEIDDIDISLHENSSFGDLSSLDNMEPLGLNWRAFVSLDHTEPLGHHQRALVNLDHTEPMWYHRRNLMSLDVIKLLCDCARNFWSLCKKKFLGRVHDFFRYGPRIIVQGPRFVQQETDNEYGTFVFATSGNNPRYGNSFLHTDGCWVYHRPAEMAQWSNGHVLVTSGTKYPTDTFIFYQGFHFGIQENSWPFGSQPHFQASIDITEEDNNESVSR